MNSGPPSLHRNYCMKTKENTRPTLILNIVYSTLDFVIYSWHVGVWFCSFLRIWILHSPGRWGKAEETHHFIPLGWVLTSPPICSMCACSRYSWVDYVSTCLLPFSKVVDLHLVDRRSSLCSTWFLWGTLSAKSILVSFLMSPILHTQ